MHAIAKKAMGLLLLVLLAVIPMACVNSGSSDNEPRKETMIGGPHGVVVQHGGGEGADVKIGGDKGVVVDH
jgi:hypothetical protein